MNEQNLKSREQGGKLGYSCWGKAYMNNVDGRKCRVLKTKGEKCPVEDRINRCESRRKACICYSGKDRGDEMSDPKCVLRGWK